MPHVERPAVHGSARAQSGAVGGRARIVAALASEVDDEDGWLSDAQDARPEWDENNQAIHFCGEGSIDVGHLVSIVMSELGAFDE